VKGLPMKLEIDVKNGWRQQDRGARGFEVRDGKGGMSAVSLASPEKKKTSRPKTQRVAALRVARRYGMLPARVFDAWLDPAIARRWLFATASRPLDYAEIDARVEGSFYFVERRDGEITEYSGKYIEIVRHRRLVFMLSTEKYLHVKTRVKVEITPLMTGCQLTLTHENVPRDCARHTRNRWTGILYGLGAVLHLTQTGSPTIRSEP